MKRYLYIVLCSVLLCGCSNHVADEIDYQKMSNEIRFGTLRDKPTTRLANDNGSNYQVYALIILDSGANGWFINNTIIPSTTAGGNDTIADGTSYYYPYDKQVVFFAYAPASSSLMTVTSDYATPSILIDYKASHANNDFTIAKSISQKNTGKVNFVFSHMMSKINVAVAMSSSLAAAGYSVSKPYVETTNPDGYKTTLIVPNDEGTINAADSTLAWSDITGPTGGVTYNNQNSFIIIPQSYTATSTTPSTDFTLQITDLDILLTVNDQTSTVFSGNLKAYGLTDGLIANNTFLMGYNYNITLTITNVSVDDSGNNVFGGAVSFSATVADWTEVTGTSDQSEIVFPTTTK